MMSYNTIYHFFSTILIITFVLIQLLNTQKVLALNTVEDHREHNQQQLPEVAEKCGGYLNAQHGVIQTPNFPHPFRVPIMCRWIIDAFHIEMAQDLPSLPSIIVYLTQMYVFTGLTFYEYALYEGESQNNVGGRLMHTITEQNFTRVSNIRTYKPYMVIEFRLDRLEGNHLRVLDNLLDVYGFNITYEISTSKDLLRNDSCTVVTCSYTGNCYVSEDFRSFHCACFDGFSGKKCGIGPRCPPNNNVCQNGGTCKHVGANASTCICPPRYTGDKCEILIPDINQTHCENSKTSNRTCAIQCPFNGRRENACKCTKATRFSPDKVRYEGEFRLQNFTAIRSLYPAIQSSTSSTKSLTSILVKSVVKYLRSKVGKIEDFKILNISSNGEVKFHFFTNEKDNGRVRDAMTHLVEQILLNNITFVPTHFSTKQDPALLLQNVLINQEQPIRQGDEFTLSCIAQGSPYMSFNWYKDGIYVNTSKATRVMDTKVLSPDSEDKTIAILYVNKATYLDNGVYTCQVIDWGIQQCKSLRVNVLLPPIVQIIPMSITVQKGENVSIKCLSPNDHHHEKFGYNWTKNKSLFPLIPGKEVWEDLYPSGSILKIYRAQKSAVYQCLVHGRADSRTASVRVEVTNRTLVPLCTAERFMNVQWPETAPGVETIQKCPDNLEGNVIRLCVLNDVSSVSWELPDFSQCKAPEFFEIEDNFRGLTYGFQNTSGVETLSKCMIYLKHRGGLYPGEGHNILRLLKDVFSYINITLSVNELSQATQTLYKIVNLLLLYEYSIISQQDIINLQRLMISQALISGTQLKTPGVEHVKMDTFVLDVTSLESQLLHNLHVPLRGRSYPNWFDDRIDIRIESNNVQLFGNHSFILNIIVYRDLSSFLPLRYVARSNDGIDLEYEIISRIINIEMGQSDSRMILPQGPFWVDLELVHIKDNYTEIGWNVTCGITDVATFRHTWDLDACTTRILNSTVTRCTCTKTGTYAVLWTRHRINQLYHLGRDQPFILLSGLIVCLILTLITLSILIPYWWHHRTSLIFLKLQCCTSIAGAMAIFIYAVRAPVNKESFIPIATSLEIFLLIGMSSHLSKLLIVYTEIVVIPRVRQHLQQTVVGVITGVPVLTVLSNHIAYRSLGLELTSWWLISGTLMFTIFVASAGVMILLFIFIYFSLMRKLHQLIDKHLDKTKALSKRIGLLSRAALIFIAIISMETASIFYLNINSNVYQYLFSLSCVVLGITIFICYIVKCESSLHLHFMRRLRLTKNIEEEYSSESVNSPLSFFTKQDGEVETDSAPPPRTHGSATGHTSADTTEELLMSETRSTKSNFYRYSEAPSSTVETYVQSVSDNSSAEKFYRSDLNIQDPHLLGSQELVDMEHYDPQTCHNYIDLVHIPSRSSRSYGDYVAETDINRKYPTDLRYYYPEGQIDTPLLRPNPGKCYIRDYQVVTPTNPEVLTTRVCVELGLVKSPQSDLIGEANISVEAPSNVLCSVDVEPVINEPLTSLPSGNVKETPLELEDSSLTESTTNSDIVIPKIDIKDTSDSSSGSERKQPEGAVGKVGTNENDNLDGMLDRISHDLDYLLNRKDALDAGTVTPQVPIVSRKTSKAPPPVNRVIGQIREEDEEEEATLKTEDVDTSIAKTVC